MESSITLTFKTKEAYERAKQIIARIKWGDSSYRLPGQALAILSEAEIKHHDSPTSKDTGTSR